MKRLLIIYNPRSSRFKDVEKEVLAKIRDLRGYMVGKYEILPTDVDDNAAKLAKFIRDDDLIIAAGGDATAVVAVNGIMLSKKTAVLGVLPYGNFNDLSRTLKTRKLEDILAGKTIKYWPLNIVVDGKHFRYASSYLTMGMTAEAVEIFDNKKIRKYLQGGHKSSWRSYVYLAKWYFKNRHKKTYLPEFKLNGKPMDKRISDYCAINGFSMMRVMKGGEWYRDAKEFRHETVRLGNLRHLFRLMSKSILKQVPGEQVTQSTVEFLQPATVEMQAEGEYKVFEKIKKVEVKKAEMPILVRQLG